MSKKQINIHLVLFYFTLNFNLKRTLKCVFAHGGKVHVN